ncbi:uncharacterized protein LOC120002468 [Tripterygium wilfordii]|uniref:uncharacterized protein LOC120002468 n=1 Tax=Tripterygium wilfordii TaxID=458696 RepID=UPI0018F848DA|nr:uncharacterized protein LOC120002468 [Tripterygium wilfordii]
MHLFGECGWTKSALFAAGMDHLPKLAMSDSIVSWLCAISQHSKRDDFNHLLICLWHVWVFRNKAVHDSYIGKPEVMGKLVDNMQTEYRVAQVIEADKYDALAPALSRTRWTPPTTNVIKINFDAAIKPPNIGLGMVARNEDGVHIASRSLCVQGPSDPFFAECLAATEALRFANSLQYGSIILEGDSALVISALRSGECALTEAGLCIGRAKGLFDL